jgi:hypothetical protein
VRHPVSAGVPSASPSVPSPGRRGRLNPPDEARAGRPRPRGVQSLTEVGDHGAVCEQGLAVHLRMVQIKNKQSSVPWDPGGPSCRRRAGGRGRGTVSGRDRAMRAAAASGLADVARRYAHNQRACSSCESSRVAADRRGRCMFNLAQDDCIWEAARPLPSLCGTSSAVCSSRPLCRAAVFLAALCDVSTSMTNRPTRDKQTTGLGPRGRSRHDAVAGRRAHKALSQEDKFPDAKKIPLRCGWVVRGAWQAAWGEASILPPLSPSGGEGAVATPLPAEDAVSAEARLAPTRTAWPPSRAAVLVAMESSSSRSIASFLL